MRFVKYLIALVAVIVITSFTLSHKESHRHSKATDAEGTIEIHDNQYACYNSVEYYLILVDSSLIIDNYSEHGDMNDTNYQPGDLLNEKLTKEEMLQAQQFMASFAWDSLEDKYSSERKKEDCDSVRQMNVEIKYISVRKSINIRDCYSNNMAKVFQFINSLIPEEKRDSLQIDYTAKEFKCHKKD